MTLSPHVLPVKEKPILFSSEMVRAIGDGRKTMTRRVIVGAPKVRLLKMVQGDGPWSHVFRRPGIYEAQLNPHGAASIEATDGEQLGIKPGEFVWHSPYGQVGDHLWVRENIWLPPELTTRLLREGADTWPKVMYDADMRDTDRDWCREHGWKRSNSIHMPRWASRYTLENTGVRVERLQEINEPDAIAEGAAESWTETWWQGYRDTGRLGLIHQQATGDEPPEWMIEPKRMNTDHMRRSAAQNFAVLWDRINAKRAPWSSNPFVWVISFSLLSHHVLHRGGTT